MKRRVLISLSLGALLVCAACDSGGLGDDGPVEDSWDNLAPVPNTNPDFRPQPHRDHPFAVAMTRDGSKALVTLRGNELEPESGLAIIDVARRVVDRTVTVGARPTAVAIHPDGDVAVVLSQLSPFAAVVDLASAQVVGQLRVGFYAADLVFNADGSRLYITNRASDQVESYVVGRAGAGLEATPGAVAPAGVNPDAIALSPDGTKVYVADAGGLGVRVFSADGLGELGLIALNAPVFDVQPMGPYMIATTLNDTNGLPCESDADFPGVQTDGIYDQISDRTCSRGFADIQNEIAFIDPTDDSVVIRYTSDTAEASEADREGDHPAPLMKVVGALPYGIAVVDETRAYVTMGASFEVVQMAVDATDPATPLLEMPRAWDTGFAPRGIATDAGGTVLVVANMLGETATVIDVGTGERVDIAVGETNPPYPATAAEIGEMFFSTSLFSTDGDQSCTHCHPDAESDGKAWGVGVVRAYGRRATIPNRNLGATKPLLIEGVFEEGDFTLEMEAVSFRPDFHDSSYALQVVRRNDFYRRQSRELVGREITFDEMAYDLGQFLISEPRLLPNPFDKDTPEVNRGREIYFRFEVACASCHPSPAFASPESFQGITTMARFDRPRRDIDPDTSLKFLENARDGFFNANTLRGLWDRRGALLHDGRARTVRETLLTPGHECLQDGERAFNEADGVFDTHAGISHLTCDELDALVAFLMTID